MRILYHHRTGSKDGQAVHIEELIGAFRAQGHEVAVVGPAAMNEVAFGGDAGFFASLRQRLPAALYELLELGYNAMAFWPLLAAYRRLKPDVIYERYNLYLLAGLLLSKLTGTRLLLEVNAPLADERREHGNLSLYGLARWIEGLTWRGADMLLPVTEVLAQRCAASGALRQRMTIVPNGVSAEFLQPDPAGRAAVRERYRLGNALVLGFTGFMRPWHGLDRVVELIAEADPALDLHLLLVGDGPVKGELEALARQRGVSQRITFAGLVERHQVPAHVAAFDIALQPHVVSYASPLKLFEYMALGRPIVAPDTPNIREVLRDGEDALLFDLADPGGFRRAIERLIAEPALRQQIGRGAQDTVARLDLTWAHNARRVAALASG